MIAASLEITVNTAGPFLAHLLRHLTDPTELNEEIARKVEQLTKLHLAGEARKRHRTANALGANPTNILSRAAESPEASADREGVILTMRPAEVLARAFRDIEIYPRNGKKWLTIPIHRRSYGKRAREFKDLFFLWPAEEGSPFLVERAANGNLIFLYLLVRKVTQKQDRTLLPSDEAYLDASELAAEEVLVNGEEVPT